jgi:hypothetical protein
MGIMKKNPNNKFVLNENEMLIIYEAIEDSIIELYDRALVQDDYTSEKEKLRKRLKLLSEARELL